MAPVLKTGEPKGFVSSNLTPSAIKYLSSTTYIEMSNSLAVSGKAQAIDGARAFISLEK
jgi:hypothetical protein